MNPETALARDTISFSNQSTDAVSYLWDFGDDSASTAMNPTHIYQKSGTYTVTLTATGEGGNGVVTGTVEVLPSMTGKWSSTFTYYNPYNGTLMLVQKGNNDITGTMELMTGQTPLPLSSTSKITGNSVKIEAIIESSKYTFIGTINADYDYITGDFFMGGSHFGNWYAIKR
ncbi:MAG TPA: hypothetical protein DC042_17940 [Bacteroidales bacterium]|nr:hypothetical protein [Bacteroidales bacterium]